MNKLIPAVNLAVDPADLVQSDRVHTSMYTDAQLFDAELEKIFYSTWIWVAHESEIPDSGSYKTTYIGKQPVIVVRDRKKDTHVLLNRCRHRGATVCEHKKGKTNSFVCPYHGWGYALDGCCAASRIRKATPIASTRPSCRWSACVPNATPA